MKRWFLVAVILTAILMVMAFMFLRNTKQDSLIVSVSYPRASHISGLERTAGLGIIPATEVHPVGDEFTVHVYVDSTLMSINAVEATLIYPVERIRVTGISKEKSIFTLWPVEPEFHNDAPSGAIHFAGGLHNPGFLGNLGIILSIDFEVIEEGVSVVEFSDGLVLANNGFGTDILQELRPAIFTTKRVGSLKADLNGDGTVGFIDLSIVLANLNKDPQSFQGDVNLDGRISFQDVSIVLAEWGS